MPSPTSSTRPTSRVSALVRYWPISASRTEAISSALNLMGPSRRQLVLEYEQIGPVGGVAHLVPDAYSNPADQVGHVVHDDTRRLAEVVCQRVRDLVLLGLGQRGGRLHQYPDPVRRLVPQRPVGDRDELHQAEPVLPVQHPEEV